MRRTDDLLSGLQHLDEADAVTLSEEYPTVTTEKKHQLYKEVEQRMRNKQISDDSEVIEKFEVTEAPEKGSFRRALTAAACLLLVAGIAGGGVWMLTNMRNDSPIVPRQEVITTENTQALMTETIEDTNVTSVELSKDDIFYRSMNTLLFLDKISGDVTIRNGYDFPFITSGHFSFDFDNEVYQARIDFALAENPTEIFQENQIFKNSSHVDAFYSYTDEQYRDVYTAILFEDGFHKNEHTDPDLQTTNKDSAYMTYGQDPTYAHELSGCFMPQEMTVGYLEDFSKWEIVEESECNGRACVIVEGTSEVYGARFRVSNFRIIIDAKTGVWLRYEGYDESGNLQDYIYTENLRFSDEAESVTLLTDETREQMISDGYFKLEDDTSSDELSQPDYLFNFTIIFDFGDRKIIVDSDRMYDWLMKNEDGTVKRNNEGDVIFDRSEIGIFVTEMAAETDTWGKDLAFHATTDGWITVPWTGFPYSTYGWEIDQAATTDLLFELLNTGESIVVEPVYMNSGYVRGKGDIGTTYVEADISEQHMWVYKYGEIVFECDFVSGTENDPERKTPRGICQILAKEKSRLLGTYAVQGYEVTVNYWMPFNNWGCGFHDTDRDAYGGDIYLSDGSYGCLELSYEDTQTLYDLVEIGMPCIVHD